METVRKSIKSPKTLIYDVVGLTFKDRKELRIQKDDGQHPFTSVTTFLSTQKRMKTFILTEKKKKHRGGRRELINGGGSQPTKACLRHLTQTKAQPLLALPGS